MLGIFGLDNVGKIIIVKVLVGGNGLYNNLIMIIIFMYNYLRFWILYFFIIIFLIWLVLYF